MTPTRESVAPEGVDPGEFNDAIVGEIRAEMARQRIDGSDLRDKIEEVTGESPGSSMWVYRRLTSGEVPLYRPAKVIPEEVNPDLATIAQAIGKTSDELIAAAIKAINRKRK